MAISRSRENRVSHCRFWHGRCGSNFESEASRNTRVNFGHTHVPKPYSKVSAAGPSNMTLVASQEFKVKTSFMVKAPTKYTGSLEATARKYHTESSALPANSAVRPAEGVVFPRATSHRQTKCCGKCSTSTSKNAHCDVLGLMLPHS